VSSLPIGHHISQKYLKVYFTQPPATLVLGIIQAFKYHYRKQLIQKIVAMIDGDCSKELRRWNWMCCLHCASYDSSLEVCGIQSVSQLIAQHLIQPEEEWGGNHGTWSDFLESCENNQKVHVSIWYWEQHCYNVQYSWLRVQEKWNKVLILNS
jgi:hypothetical protein